MHQGSAPSCRRGSVREVVRTGVTGGQFLWDAARSVGRFRCGTAGSGWEYVGEVGDSGEGGGTVTG
jgi:hypothetical protein